MKRLEYATSFRLAAVLAAACFLAGAQAGADDPEVSNDLLVNAQDHDNMWIHYGRNYAGWRHIPTDTIDKSNVNRLAPKWVYQTGVSGGGFADRLWGRRHKDGILVDYP